MALRRHYAIFSCFIELVYAVIDPSDPCGQKLYNSSGTSSANLTFSTAEDVKIAVDCTAIYPNIVVEKSFPGVFRLPNLDTLWGEIFVGNAEDRPRVEASALTGLSFPKLTFADMRLYGVASLSTLDFPILQTVSYLFLGDLPALTELPFGNLANLTNLIISNTGVKTLQWEKCFPSVNGGLFGKTDGSVTNYIAIGNNSNLQEINMEGLKRVTRLDIWGNGNTDFTLGDMSQLEILSIAGIKTFRNPAKPDNKEDHTLVSRPVVSFKDNTFTNLTVKSFDVFHSLEISNNSNLESFAFPDLNELDDDLNIVDNPKLKVINASSFSGSYLNGSIRVGGDVNLIGAFTELSWLPNAVTVQSVKVVTSENASCVAWDETFRYKAYKSTLPYDCTTNGPHYTPEPTPIRSSGSANSNSGYQLPAGIIAGIVVSSVSFVVWLIVVWWCCVKYRRRNRERKAMAAQVSTIAATLESQKQQKSTKTHQKNGTGNHEGPGFQKPELASPSIETAVRGHDVSAQELGGKEKEPGSELDATNTSPIQPQDVDDTRNHYIGELSGGTQLSRVEELEVKERALAAREDAAIRAREEALRAREQEVELLERQNQLAASSGTLDRK